MVLVFVVTSRHLCLGAVQVGQLVQGALQILNLRSLIFQLLLKTIRHLLIAQHPFQRRTS